MMYFKVIAVREDLLVIGNRSFRLRAGDVMISPINSFGKSPKEYASFIKNKIVLKQVRQHAMMYIGNGQFIHDRGDTENPVKIFEPRHDYKANQNSIDYFANTSVYRMTDNFSIIQKAISWSKTQMSLQGKHSSHHTFGAYTGGNGQIFYNNFTCIGFVQKAYENAGLELNTTEIKLTGLNSFEKMWFKFGMDTILPLTTTGVQTHGPVKD